MTSSKGPDLREPHPWNGVFSDYTFHSFPQEKHQPSSETEVKNLEILKAHQIDAIEFNIAFLIFLVNYGGQNFRKFFGKSEVGSFEKIRFDSEVPIKEVVFFMDEVRFLMEKW